MAGDGCGGRHRLLVEMCADDPMVLELCTAAWASTVRDMTGEIFDTCGSLRITLCSHEGEEDVWGWDAAPSGCRSLPSAPPSSEPSLAGNMLFAP